MGQWIECSQLQRYAGSYLVEPGPSQDRLETIAVKLSISNGLDISQREVNSVHRRMELHRFAYGHFLLHLLSVSCN